jgi:lipopolysaccharide heptosyltransferase II
VTLLTSTGGAAAAAYIPEVDGAITYDAPWMKATHHRHDSEQDLAFVELLRQGGYDAAVIFTVFSQNPLPAAVYCYLAGIPLRLAHCRENPYQLLTDWVQETEPEQRIRHEVRRQLDLVGAVGSHTENERLSFSVRQKDRDALPGLFDERELDPGRPWLLVHPGASAPSRRYPPEQFAEVVRSLAVNQGFQILLTGNEQERELVRQIQALAKVPVISLAGRLGLGKFAALIEAAPVLISNNSGPVHLAAAVGTPVVDLYALTNPQHTPWLTPHRVLSFDVPCRHCFRSVCPEQHQHCLSKIEPVEVVTATLALLSEAGRPTRPLVPSFGPAPLCGSSIACIP